MAAIAIEHLGKTYADGTQAVADLNLEIMDGEFLVEDNVYASHEKPLAAKRPATWPSHRARWSAH